MRTFFAYHFFANNSIIIEFKGIVIKLSCQYNFPGIAYFYNFFDIVQLSYKPSNFAMANKPYAMG